MTSGCYCLCIRVTGDTRVRVGALGDLDFPAGLYVYVGSALIGLERRVARHAATSRGEGRAVHWHVDYLLRSPGVGLESVYVKGSPVREECRLAGAVAEHGWPVPGFGCSDCRCLSHLYGVESAGFLVGLGLRKVVPDAWPFPGVTCADRR